MKMLVVRDQCGAECTVGQMFVDGEFECFTMEDVVRPDGVKVYGQTAIPAGTYDVIVNWSNRFKRELPLLLNVPGFEGVRIHTGNTAADTEGCILVGKERNARAVTDSRKAFIPLFDKIQAAHDAGERITLEIRAA